MTDSPTSVPGASTRDWLVERTIAQAVTRAERAFALVRGSFCVVILGLFLFTNPTGSQGYGARLSFECAVATLAVGFSAWMWHRTRIGLLGDRTLRVSVGIDALVCTLGLATNLLAPGASYQGALESLDIAVVLLVITSSIFRVSRGAALTSGAACSLGLVLILGLDARAGHAVPLDKALLMAVYVATATAVALFGVRRARELFGRVGVAAARAEQARSSVFGLLEDHHDLRSVLCNLQLNADRLSELRGDDSEVDPKWRALGTALDSGISELSDATARTRDRALLALEGLEAPSPADVTLAFQSAARAAERRFGSLAVTLVLPPDMPRVSFGAGTDGLERLLLHLFSNAAEGDGKRGATRVAVEIVPRPGLAQLSVTVRDDGPGFSPELLSAVGRARGTTTKPGSAGIGLWLSRSTVVAVGGTLEFDNGSEGAEIRLLLPLAVANVPFRSRLGG